jgi:ornithine--oxo-acid transaminase
MVALQVLKDEHMVENAETLGAYFRQQIKDLGHEHISIVRGKGLLNAIVIGHPDKNTAWELCLQMMNNGLLAKPTHGDKIRFAPPLSITRPQLDECIAIIKTSLASI